MGSIWNRMKTGPMADRNQDGGETSGDTPSALLTMSSKENNVDKSQSAPQPTCEERIHYPIYDPLNPNHNPVIARSRSTLWATRFPTTPKSKTVHSAKSGSWTSRSPVQSLRKAKSGFLALAEELRSKPSFCRGDPTSKSVTSSSDPVSPIKQNPYSLGDINSTEAEHSFPTVSPSNATPILKLDFASSQMSLSPFVSSSSNSSKDKTSSLSDTSVTQPFSGSSELPTVATRPSLPYNGPSFLPPYELHSPLEDPFQNSLTQSQEPGDISKSGDNAADPVQAPLDAERDTVPLKIATEEENTDIEKRNCNTGDIEGVSTERQSVYSSDASSVPVEAAEQQDGPGRYHALNESKTYSEEAQSHPTQSQGKLFGSLNPVETKSSAKDDLDSPSVNPGDPDSSKLTPQEHHSLGLPGISDFEANERLSETSTEEDSDFGVEIYRTQCLGEQNPEPSSPDNVATMAIWSTFTVDGEKPEKLGQFQRSSQDSNIQATRITTTTSQQAMESKRPSSDDSSNKSTIRWEDGFVRHEIPRTEARFSPSMSALRKVRSGHSHSSSITSHVGGAQDDKQLPSRNSLSSGSHLDSSIGTKDNTPLTPSGDLRFAAEAIERTSGHQFNDSSEDFPTQTPLKDTDSSIKTEPISKQVPSSGDDGHAENLPRSNSRNTAHGSGKSKTHGGEVTSASLEESIVLTVSHRSQSDGSIGSDGVLSHKESSRVNSIESSQVDARSDATDVVTYSTVSSPVGSSTVPEGLQSVDTKAKPFDLKTSRSSTDEIGDTSQDVCYRIISDGSIHSGPGLDRQAPSKSAQTALPEAIGPSSLRPGGNKSRESHSNATGNWSSGSEDCGFAPWYTQNERRDQ